MPSYAAARTLNSRDPEMPEGRNRIVESRCNFEPEDSHIPPGPLSIPRGLHPHVPRIANGNNPGDSDDSTVAGDDNSFEDNGVFADEDFSVSSHDSNSVITDADTAISDDNTLVDSDPSPVVTATATHAPGTRVSNLSVAIAASRLLAALDTTFSVHSSNNDDDVAAASSNLHVAADQVFAARVAENAASGFSNNLSDVGDRVFAIRDTHNTNSAAGNASTAGNASVDGNAVLDPNGDNTGHSDAGLVPITTFMSQVLERLDNAGHPVPQGHWYEMTINHQRRLEERSVTAPVEPDTLIERSTARLPGLLVEGTAVRVRRDHFVQVLVRGTRTDANFPCPDLGIPYGLSLTRFLNENGIRNRVVEIHSIDLADELQITTLWDFKIDGSSYLAAKHLVMDDPNFQVVLLPAHLAARYGSVFSCFWLAGTSFGSVLVPDWQVDEWDTARGGSQSSMWDRFRSFFGWT